MKNIKNTVKILSLGILVSLSLPNYTSAMLSTQPWRNNDGQANLSQLLEAPKPSEESDDKSSREANCTVIDQDNVTPKNDITIAKVLSGFYTKEINQVSDKNEQPLRKFNYKQLDFNISCSNKLFQECNKNNLIFHHKVIMAAVNKEFDKIILKNEKPSDDFLNNLSNEIESNFCSQFTINRLKQLYYVRLTNIKKSFEKDYNYLSEKWTPDEINKFKELLLKKDSYELYDSYIEQIYKNFAGHSLQDCKELLSVLKTASSLGIMKERLPQ